MCKKLPMILRRVHHVPQYAGQQVTTCRKRKVYDNPIPNHNLAFFWCYHLRIFDESFIMWKNFTIASWLMGKKYC